METVKNGRAISDTDLTVSDLKLLCEEFKESSSRRSCAFPDDQKKLWGD